MLGLSDLLCGMAGQQAGTAIPGSFALTLNQTATATMTWTTPAGGADSYLLQRIPLDGTPIDNVPLAGGAITAGEAVTAAGTCFPRIAFQAAAFGTSDVPCGVPGVSTLGAKATRNGKAKITRLARPWRTHCNAWRAGGSLCPLQVSGTESANDRRAAGR